MSLFKDFLKAEPINLMQQGQNSLGGRVFGDKNYSRFNRFEPMGAQFQSFGHDATLGDNLLGGQPVDQSFRQRGREDMFGLRAREVGAGAAAAFGGYAAWPYLAGAFGGGSTSATAAPTAAPAGAGATQVGYAGGTAGPATASSSPAWQQYARQGQGLMNQGQQKPQQSQPLQHMFVGQGYPWS